MPKLQHLEGHAFYSERDINCFPQFRTLLQARGRRGDDTRRLKIIWQAAREAAAIKGGARALAERRVQTSPRTRALLLRTLLQNRSGQACCQ